MPISEGIKLGRYEIRAHIGAGGMGQVYLAQDTSELDRAVAIKLLPAEVAADPKWMKRFIREARLGHFTQALTLAQSALKVERNRNVLTRAALAFALAGDIAKAQTLIEELEQKHPKDTMVNQVWLPEIKAVIELRKNNAQGALELLETTRRYEAAAGISPQTLRSMVYLKLGQGAQAVTEARRILEHRGQGSLSTLWPLAYLTLARASAMQGDTTQARESYQNFFVLWKDADQDIPILIEAKREFEKVK